MPRGERTVASCTTGLCFWWNEPLQANQTPLVAHAEAGKHDLLREKMGGSYLHWWHVENDILDFWFWGRTSPCICAGTIWLCSLMFSWLLPAGLLGNEKTNKWENWRAETAPEKEDADLTMIAQLVKTCIVGELEQTSCWGRCSKWNWITINGPLVLKGIDESRGTSRLVLWSCRGCQPHHGYRTT